ncbi:hypothetical protein BD289DRAFT_454992 [Coniella lustricola]|uniref:Uncharacterized protein n=1 Tax=Coniella lustricola TaxID=2025994 RepID=A0A2T3A1E5_9PEZI|nr:hypothetical protein BD289DRAFT_454992 [Coniella lustricola]
MVSRPPDTVLFGCDGLNHTSFFCPKGLSPCSPDSSVAGIAEPDELESYDGNGIDSPVSQSPRYAGKGSQQHSHQTDLDIPPVNFTIEELSDFELDELQAKDDVIRPHAIEYADSERSRSRTRLAPDDPHMINNLRNLNCHSPDPHDPLSDESDVDESTHLAILQAIRAAERSKRMSHSSIGTKRTMSECGSESDREDVRHFIGFDEVGSSAKRLKRRIAGDRRSLNFSDPPPRIDEVVEPEELDEKLARELPFYEYASMEVDSPRSPDA